MILYSMPFHIGDKAPIMKLKNFRSNILEYKKPYILKSKMH